MLCFTQISWRLMLAMFLYTTPSTTEPICMLPAQYSDLVGFFPGQRLPRLYYRADTFDNMTSITLPVACQQGCDYYPDCQVVVGSLEESASSSSTGKCYFYDKIPDLNDLEDSDCGTDCSTGLFAMRKRTAAEIPLSSLTTTTVTTTESSFQSSDISSSTETSSSTTESTGQSTEDPLLQTTTTTTTSDTSTTDSTMTTTTSSMITSETITTETTTMDTTTTTTTSTEHTSTTSTCRDVPTLSPQQDCQYGQYYVGDKLFTLSCYNFVLGPIYDYETSVSLAQCMEACAEDTRCVAVRYHTGSSVCGKFDQRPSEADPVPNFLYAYAQIETDCLPESASPSLPFAPIFAAGCDRAIKMGSTDCESGMYNAYGKLYDVVCGQHLQGMGLPYSSTLGDPSLNGLRDYLQDCSEHVVCHGVDFEISSSASAHGDLYQNPGNAEVGLDTSVSSPGVGYALMKGRCEIKVESGCPGLDSLPPRQRSCIEGRYYVNGQLFSIRCGSSVYDSPYIYYNGYSMQDCLEVCAADRLSPCTAAVFETASGYCALFATAPVEASTLQDSVPYGYAQIDTSCEIPPLLLPMSFPNSPQCATAVSSLPSPCADGVYNIGGRLYEVSCGVTPVGSYDFFISSTTMTAEDCIMMCSSNFECHNAQISQVDVYTFCWYGFKVATPNTLSPSPAQNGAVYARLIGICPTCQQRNKACQQTTDCCGSDECSGGVCRKPCPGLNSFCIINADCGPCGQCYNGVCTIRSYCSVQGQLCTDSNISQCCSNGGFGFGLSLTCNSADNICKKSGCLYEGLPCEQIDDCCAGLFCAAGSCRLSI